MAYVLAALQAIAAIPKIGELIERVVRDMGQFFAEQAYRKKIADEQGATDLGKKALTKEQKIEALKNWHRILG